MHYVENDNKNIINKLKKILYIYNRRAKNLKYKYFYKYYSIIHKLKSINVNNNSHYNKINKEENKTKFSKNNNYNKSKGIKNIIIRDSNLSNELMEYNINYNNIYNNNGNYSENEKVINNNNKKSILTKKRNYSSNMNSISNIDFLSSIKQDNYKTNNYLHFMSNNKKIFNHKSFNNEKKKYYNKDLAYKINKKIINKSNYNSNNNIIIDYINEMEKYNKMIMEQKLENGQKFSIEKSTKNKKKIFSHKKTNSCLNTPFFNKIPNLSNITINTKNPFFSFANSNNKIQCNTEENKIIHSNQYYSLNPQNDKNCNGSKTEKNTIRIYCPNHKKITKGFVKKYITKIDKIKNKCNDINNNNNDICRTKILGINYVSEDMLNKRNNSYSYQKNINIKSNYKKDNDYYYENNSSNFCFKNNSFLSNNLSSKKNSFEPNNTNVNTINKNKENNINYFSPILLNRLNNNKYKIPKANTTNNKIKIDNIINYKNKNIIKNLLDNYNNSLSTNYKDKLSTKDVDESGNQLYFKNNTSRNCQITKSNVSIDGNNNLIFNTNNKNSKEKSNNKNYLFPKNIKKNIIIKNIEKNLMKKTQNKKMMKTNSYNIPISTNKKQNNNHILQNISFSNNSPEQSLNDNNHIQSFNKINKIINSALTKNNKKNNDNLQHHHIRISSLFSVLKEEKKNSIISESRPQFFPCFNVINEKFEKNNINNNNNINNVENKNNDKCLKTSFESLSDSKMYELAKTYIEKDECFDKHQMEQILKTKKISKK